MALYNSSGNQKDDADRVRRNAPVYNKVQVRWDGVERGFSLPRFTPFGQEWPDATIQWWETWRTSAQSMVFTDTDWDFLLDTAVLHAMMWAPRGNAGGVSQTQLASEVRQRVSKFGATFEDRTKLRMSIETPMSLQADQEVLNEVENDLVDYEKRLLDG